MYHVTSDYLCIILKHFFGLQPRHGSQVVLEPHALDREDEGLNLIFASFFIVLAQEQLICLFE